MSKHLRAFGFIFTLAALLAVFGPQTARADADDPPSRVARLSYIHGNLSFEPGGTDDWVTATLNRPVTTGDKIWADNDSRAELHIGSASLRLSSNTGFSFLNLSDNVTQIRLTQGTLRIRIKRLDDNETFEVDTPNLAFSALRPGIYRISVNESGDTTIVKVRDGQGEVTGGGSAYNIRAHEVGNFSGIEQISADLQNFGNDDDDFDRWCLDRDRHEDTSVSARYVSRDVIGYEDLDDYGGWRPVPEYGTVWFPHTTIVGWAPYHYGHWAYIYPWGYTWVDDAPWGFAPFHYGRWIFVNGVWGWVPAPPPAPGVVYVRPVYAPALVAWVGGPHFSIGVSVGGASAVGWFPLGPREVYVPTYPVSRTYVSNVNVSNTTVNNTVVNNYYNNVVVNKNTTVINQTTYVNQTVPGAVAATTPQAFSSAQPVAKNVVRVNAREVASAPVNVAAPSAAPSRQAVLGGGAVTQVRPTAASLNRPVVAKVQPPPPPVSFAQQQQAFTTNGGKPPAMSQIHQMQTANVQQQPVHPNVKIAPPAPPANLRNEQSGGNQPGNNQPGQRQQGFNNNPGNNRPPATAGQPQPSAANQPGNAGANGNTSRRTFEDRPPSARPNQGNAGATGNVSVNPNSANSGTNSALDQKHQQELEQLRTRHDQERQKVEQQQVRERQQLAQQNADEQKQRDLNQKHQQQLEKLENKHAIQEQKLQDKHQQERQKQDSQQPKNKGDNKGDHPGHER